MTSALEILAPASNHQMIKAAVENGADAVYFGVKNFNARLRADNFDLNELSELMQSLHLRSVKGFLTLNTLVFSEELEQAIEVLKVASQAKIDAVIVQDLGLVYLINKLFPDLHIHASTQMTITSAESIQALNSLGLKVNRVVLARELSTKEIARITKQSEMPLEVFVHGALCVAYSGQCLTSEALGGRSANRGECAQACRLPYDLVVDGEVKDLDGISYLLSPKDLAGYNSVDELRNLGVVSLKIEGRLKSPEYVAATVGAYRSIADKTHNETTISPQMLANLEATFSRGFTGGYLEKVDHQTVVEGRYPKKRGSYLGKILQVSNKGIVLNAENSIKAGDGVVFDSGRPDVKEEGGRVFEVFKENLSIKRFNFKAKTEKILLTFANSQLDLTKIKVGDRLWKTSDPEIEAQLRQSFIGNNPKFCRPISISVFGKLGAPLKIIFQDQQLNQVEVIDTKLVEAAKTQPLNQEKLFQQLGRLGGSPFVLAKLDCYLQGDLMVPFSRLNQMRREGIDRLLELRKNGNVIKNDFSWDSLSQLKSKLMTKKPNYNLQISQPQLSVLCRNLDQVRAAVTAGISTIYTDFEDIRLHREARVLIPRKNISFIPATLRIVKPGEAASVLKLLQAEPDGILVRNLAAWETLRRINSKLRLVGDYSLNVANEFTAAMLLEKNFSLLTASYDLNYDQMKSLFKQISPQYFEVTVHQHMPMFHMEHCVFCRFLSKGTDSSNCGRPCEKHSVMLRDRLGYEHPLKADFACRNTVFNSVAQSASRYLDGLLDQGVMNFRLDLLDQNQSEAIKIIDLYLSALDGSSSGSMLWRKLNVESKLGVTRGSLDKRENFLKILN